jgi:NADH-quinone oxidoreductase subunit C
MDQTTIAASLKEAVAEATIAPAPSLDLHTTLVVGRGDLLPVARTLRDRPDLQFAVLAELTAIDWLPRAPRFELTYLLVSIAHRHRVRLKVALRGEDACVDTVSGIWPAANWLEREVWDLFGIVFAGHPDPRRLLMPEDWEGHPLRKDYPVQIRLRPRATEPLQVSEDEFRANLERDRLMRR